MSFYAWQNVKEQFGKNTVKKMFFYFIGKSLCKVCKCEHFYVDCSGKGLYHMPWTNKDFGLNITWYGVK